MSDKIYESQSQRSTKMCIIMVAILEFWKVSVTAIILQEILCFYFDFLLNRPFTCEFDSF